MTYLNAVLRAEEFVAGVLRNAKVVADLQKDGKNARTETQDK